MPEPFRGTIPAGLRYDTHFDMWVRRDGDDIIVGATAFGVWLAGKVIAFTAKPRGAEVARGRGLGTIESAKTVIAVHAPVAFVLAAGNETAEERPQIINDDPHGAGWMARGKPLDWEADAARLVDAAAYAAHVRTMDPGAEVDVQ